MFRAIAAIAFSLLTLTSAGATETSLFTASVDQPSVEFMGDGIAAERAGLAAFFEHTSLRGDTDMPATVAENLAMLEPTVTGSLVTTAWEDEEPMLVKAYFESRSVYEAMLTP